MIQVPISPIPNQSFTTILNDNRYQITIKETRGVMAATILRNDVVVVDGARIVGGTAIFPYIYQEKGNFFILTENDDLPDYKKFGITQFLFYATQEEINVYRA